MRSLQRKDKAIMQLSKFTDYTFRALIYLAKHKDKLCTVEELATHLDVSEHHMKKVIHQLAKTDYVISIKGRSGGLRLGVEPCEINLGQVLRMTEETGNIVECFSKGEVCRHLEGGCRLKGIVQKALNKFIQEFDQYTLEDVLR